MSLIVTRPVRTMRAKFPIILVLVAATLAVYWQAVGNGFVNLDDPSYVTENPHVVTGLTWENIRWAFTTTEMGSWHPLTWLSHMADCQVFGLNPPGHHLTSVLLHAVNAVLLFLLFARITGAPWRSGFVAALFALHPLHVESVAWVAERKDVLSTLLFLLALLAYARYVQQPGSTRYLAVCAAFFLGLMAKPMLVTLPFVLLLLDYWPLARVSTRRSGPPHPAFPRGLLVEKIPLVALALAFSVITFYAQKGAGAVAAAGTVPLAYRLENALVVYVTYLGKMLWPGSLAVLYPLPPQVPLWQWAGALLVLCCISVAVFRLSRRAPYLPVGWLWYLGTLVPVIGLVQVGVQAMADRYTYIPLVGIFVMIAWGVPDAVGNWRRSRAVLAAAALAVTATLAAVTRQQLGYWENSVKLFTHTLRVTSDNDTAHLNLGMELMSEGRTEEAISHYREALRINPGNYLAHLDLGVVLAAMGREAEALPRYQEALRLNPDSDVTRFHLGVSLLRQGQTAEAVDQFRQALALNPVNFYAQYNLGLVLAGQGQTDEAISHFAAAVRLRPDFVPGHTSLGLALARNGRLDEAIGQFSEALRLDPSDPAARSGLEAAKARIGEPSRQR